LRELPNNTTTTTTTAAAALGPLPHI